MHKPIIQQKEIEVKNGDMGAKLLGANNGCIVLRGQQGGAARSTVANTGGC
jgi:hypothetical protein